MASPFSLDKGGVGRAEYAKLLAENQKRYPNDRDKAVRSPPTSPLASAAARRSVTCMTVEPPRGGGGGGAKGGGGGGGGGGGKTKA